MGSGRKKILIKKIENIRNRRVTFTKRRNGLIKKAAELSILTGCKVCILTMSSANKPFFHGDLELLDTAAAEFFKNSNCGKLNALSDSCFDVAKCGTSGLNEVGLGSYNEGCDGKDLLISVDGMMVADNGGGDMDASCSDMMPLMNSNCSDEHTCFTNDEMSVALVAENGGRGMDASSSDPMMNTMMPWEKNNCYQNNPFQIVPCSSSGCYLSDDPDYHTGKNYTENLQFGSNSDAGSDGLNVNDVSTGSSEEEELYQLLLRKQSLEAFKEAMLKQYRLTCDY